MAKGSVGERECDIQNRTVQLLGALGYTVLETTSHVRGGGSWATGVDEGIPDLLVTRREWPAFAWLGIEMKTSTGTLRPAQQELFACRRIAIARTEFEAYDWVRAFEKSIFGRNYSYVRLQKEPTTP